MRYAKQLLAEPDVPVKEVCFASGFNDPNYFTRQFKKMEGITRKSSNAWPRAAEAVQRYLPCTPCSARSRAPDLRRSCDDRAGVRYRTAVPLPYIRSTAPP